MGFGSGENEGVTEGGMSRIGIEMISLWHCVALKMGWNNKHGRNACIGVALGYHLLIMYKYKS